MLMLYISGLGMQTSHQSRPFRRAIRLYVKMQTHDEKYAQHFGDFSISWYSYDLKRYPFA